jgi:hypothetical protein
MLFHVPDPEPGRHKNFTFGWLQSTGNKAEQRCFSAAVRADKTDFIPFCNAERYAAEHFTVGKVHCDVLKV